MRRQKKSQPTTQQQTKSQQTTAQQNLQHRKAQQTRSEQRKSEQAKPRGAKLRPAESGRAKGQPHRQARRQAKRQTKYRTREEVIAGFQECAREVGHTPTYPEMRRVMRMTHGAYRRYFATFTQALEAAGLEPRGAGHKIPMAKLFEDWAAVARKVGRCPTSPEYDAYGTYSMQPMHRRFGVWANVPGRMREHIQRCGLEKQWADVLALITDHQIEAPAGRKRGARLEVEPGPWHKIPVMEEQTVYGPPLGPAGLAHAPVNEAGVLVLFGMMALRLGFTVLHVQAGFPDCEALLEVEPNRWQRVRIEVDYRSKNFLMHGHDAKGCDLIVCWEHDWEDCPVRVLALKEVMSGNQQSAIGN